MGQPLLNLFLSKYEAIGDFQTLAMLLCIFSQEIPEIKASDEWIEPEKPLKKESVESIEKKRPALKVQYPSDEEEASEALSASVQPESLLHAMGHRRYRSNSDVTPSLEEFSAIFSWYAFRRIFKIFVELLSLLTCLHFKFQSANENPSFHKATL